MPTTSLSRPRAALRRLTRSLLVVHPGQGQALRALHLTVAVVAGLVLASVVFGPTAGAMGLIGAMGAGVARDAPIRRRLLTMVTVAVLTLTNAVVGMAIGAHVWMLPPVMTVVTLVGVWAWQALRTGPPGPITMLFALVYGQHIASMGYPGRLILPVLAVAWAGAAAATLLLFLLDVNGPVRDAVDQAEEDVSAYRDRPDDLTPAAAGELRMTAHMSVEEAWAALFDAKLPVLHDGSELSELRERLVGVHLNLVEVLHSESFPTAPLDISDTIETVPQGRPPAGYLLRTGMSRGSRAWLVALRAAIAVLLASSTVIASPIGRPYWAVLSALIILHMGASRTDLTIRGVHRVVGTVFGVLLYLLVVQAHAGPWSRLAIVALAIYLMNLFVGRNYALGVVFVTVYALLLLPIASTLDTVTFMRERVAETAIGVVASLVAIWFVGRRAPVMVVRGQYRRTLHAMHAVLRDQSVGQTLTQVALENRRNLLFELSRASEVLSTQRKDDPQLAHWLGAETAIARFGFDVLARSWRRIGPTDRSSGVAARSLQWLISSLPPISSTDIDADDLRNAVEGIHLDYMHRTLGGPASTGATLPAGASSARG